MADMWFDVDAAITGAPVNIMPLLDDTDFKTRETAVAYNAAGMDLVWNFVTSAGAFTQTAVTPTTAGNYDWTHQGDGMYTIEIPASGGASINNDTEGYGWFTGLATGVLPWRGPIIGFRAAAINDSLCDTNTTGLLAPTTAGRTLDVASTGEAGLDFANVNLPAGSVPVATIIENGTMQAGSTSSTAVLRSATSFADDLVIGATIVVTGGTGAGQSRIIYDWVSTTDTASVSPNWTTTPDNTSTYIVVPTPPAPTNIAAVPAVNVTHFGGTAGTFASGRPETNTSHIAGSSVSTSSAQIGVNVVNAGGTAWGSGAITAASIATDAITAAKVAADAVTEIQSGLATAAALDTVDNFLDTEVAAILAAVDTEVAAIKAKTDSLTFTVANELDVNVQSINGATVTGDGNATPWDGA